MYLNNNNDGGYDTNVEFSFFSGSVSSQSRYSVANVSERDFLRTEGDPAAAGYTIKEAVALTRSVVGQRHFATGNPSCYPVICFIGKFAALTFELATRFLGRGLLHCIFLPVYLIMQCTILFRITIDLLQDLMKMVEVVIGKLFGHLPLAQSLSLLYH